MRLGNETFESTGPVEAAAPPPPPVDDEPELSIPGADVTRESVPLFSELPEDAFLELLERLHFRRFSAGDVVLREGETGKSIYVLASGRVRVVRGYQTRAEVELAQLSDGAFFGEMALLTGAPRVASVVAVDDSEVLEITERILQELTARHASVGRSLRKFYRQRLLANVMAISPLFRAFDVADRRSLVEKFKLREVTQDTVIIPEGEPSDGLYVVMHGIALVTKRRDDRTVPLAVLKEGDVFGEMSLLTRRPASATVTAKRKALILRMPKAAFDELKFTHPAILEVVSELTDQRAKVTEQILAGHMDAPREAFALV
jgi:CRP-like cAMP-binding protein